ncbi:hypothetical protein [Rhodococcus sp. LB1]|uniref:hypothetical protein n=1 Tax=Rhodococcus sp. LB1 TaxID=1807499 RepID=UPI00077A626A|nr:hypothetical protein [Rhodococcus sp. LB1]KXX60606.1 hypothetical protein AZG88_37045 [Rhodococcus sp. LB1]
MTNTLTNRHGDEIRIGQLWADDPRRTVVRTLRIDGLDDAGSLGAVAVCTVVQAHDTDTGQVTAPGRVVTINIDRLHTTGAGNGYRRAPANTAPQGSAPSAN